MQKPSIFLIVFIFITALVLLKISSCASGDYDSFSETLWEKKVEQTRIKNLYAAHYEEGRYFAPWMAMKEKNLFDVLRWRFSFENNYSKEEETYLPKVLPNVAERIKQTGGDFILWVGHNTFLVRIGNRYWLTDPIFSKRALLPARKTPPALTISEVNAIAKDINILISHNHYDHLDRSSMEELSSQASVYVPMGLESYVRKMNKNKVREMDWWEEITLDENVNLVCLPAQHWSVRINQFKDRSLWASWLLITPRATLYFGGDSGYFKGFREIGRRYPGIDYAFMASTAYQPRWFMHYQHMNVEEAVRGFEDLGARFFIPTQWGTFRLGSEPAGYPGLDLKHHIEKHRLGSARFKIMDIGQILYIGE